MAQISFTCRELTLKYISLVCSQLLLSLALTAETSLPPTGAVQLFGKDTRGQSKPPTEAKANLSCRSLTGFYRFNIYKLKAKKVFESSRLFEVTMSFKVDLIHEVTRNTT